MDINTKTKYVKERYDALTPKFVEIPGSNSPKKFFQTNFFEIFKKIFG